MTNYRQEKFRQPDKIINFLTGQFYREKSTVFIRELLQNAFDAITLFQGLMQDQEESNRHEKDYFTKYNKVRVILERVPSGLPFFSDEEYPDYQVSVVDTGIGLDTREDFPVNFDVLKDVIDLKSLDLFPSISSRMIGQFGIGRLSVFRVSDVVRYVTRPARLHKDELKKTFHEVVYLREWVDNQRHPSYTLLTRSDQKIDSDVIDQGTQVTVFLKKFRYVHGEPFEQRMIRQNAKDIANPDRLQAAIQTYIVSSKSIELELVDKTGWRTVKIPLNLSEDNFLPIPFADVPREKKRFYDNCSIPDVPGVKFTVTCVAGPSHKVVVHTNGMLVSENYQELGTSSSVSTFTTIVHIVDDRHQKLRLQHSRELFVEDENFEAFRASVQSYVARFEQFLLQNSVPDVSLSPDSDQARLLESRYYKHNRDTLLLAKIHKTVQFQCFWQGGRHNLTLEEMVDFFHSKGVSKVYYEFARLGRVRTVDHSFGSYERMSFGDSPFFIHYFAQFTDTVLVKIFLHPEGLNYPPYFEILDQYLRQHHFSLLSVNDQPLQKIIPRKEWSIKLGGVGSHPHLHHYNISIATNLLLASEVQPAYVVTSLNYVTTFLNIAHPTIQTLVENEELGQRVVELIGLLATYHNRAALEGSATTP